MPLRPDEPTMWLPRGRSLQRLDLRVEPLLHAPSRPGRLETTPDGALLHVPADSSYLSDGEHEPVLRDGRVVVRGRCLDDRGSLGVVARMLPDGDERSGYALLVHPAGGSFRLIDFRVSARGSDSRVIFDGQASDAIRGPGETNAVELRYGGTTLQAFVNGVLVASVTDRRAEMGTCGWVVRAHQDTARVLLEQVETSEVGGVVALALPPPPPPLRLAPPPAPPRTPLPPPVDDEIPVAAIIDVAAGEPATAADRSARAPDLARLDDHERRQLARLPACPPDTLTALAASPDVWLRQAVATHPLCPTRTLERLAADVDWLVRLAVASRLDCPPLLLDRLASDERSIVREVVARHPSCPVALLERLALDGHARIDRAIASHPGCPPALRDRLAASASPRPRARMERVWFRAPPAGRPPRSSP